MLLVLVRHGDAAYSTPDAKRELSACGREEVERAMAISYTDFRHRKGDKTVNGDYEAGRALCREPVAAGSAKLLPSCLTN